MKFERILYNLLSNAIKYTPDQGSVSVALEYIDGQLSVFIKDTGPGINQLYQATVFNKFYREPQYNKENTPNGLGIGLYVVKKFVSVMNGTVSIDSQPGQGTTPVSYTHLLDRQVLNRLNFQESLTVETAVFLL